MVSGTGCPATCTDPTAPSKCTIEAREGCFCKPGFVLSDDKCIKQEECGCKDSNGDYFPVSINQGEFGSHLHFFFKSSIFKKKKLVTQKDTLE
jgi:hypothetical protein